MTASSTATPARIVVNGDVRTMDGGTIAEAIAFRAGRIVALGTRRAVEDTVGPGAEFLDARGGTVLPGFIDAHQHPSIAALYGGGVRLTRPRVTDIGGLQRALQETARTLPPGEWLVGTEWDEALLAERRPPTRAELDDAAPDRPVFALHYSCHAAVANSRALELAGIDRHTPDPSGGVIGRGEGGVPNGHLIERGMSRVESLARASLGARDVEGFLTRLGEHYRALMAAGITRVVDAATPGDLATLYREADRRGLVTLPTVLMPVSTTGYLETPRDVLGGPVTGHTEGNLTVGPVKLVLDGAPGCAMCLSWWQVAGVALGTWALVVRKRSLDPIRVGMSVQPRFGAKIRTGIHLYRPGEARAFIADAANAGFAVACHAEGNEAIAGALAAYAAAGGALHRAGTPRLEHVIFANENLAARIAGAGVAAVVQPHFLDGIPAFGDAPSIPGLRTKPLRWLLDRGAAVVGSSDYPVTGFDPLDGVRAAVTRRLRDGRVREADQRITLDEALALYTRNAARAVGCLGECGTLAVGKRADLVVLSSWLAEDTLADARVAATVVGGEVAHGVGWLSGAAQGPS